MNELAARLAAHQRQEIASLERAVEVHRGLADKYERKLNDAKQRINETEMIALDNTANSNEA